jgi:hypothetical protein
MIWNDMRKAGYPYLAAALALLLLAAALFLSSGRGLGVSGRKAEVLNREMEFVGGLHNSLYYLDRAKWGWLEEKNKSEQDVPTMEDLAPYLGEWTNHIARFMALGITYRITSLDEPQSDVATLTRDLRFRRGIGRFYRAGTSYCIRTRWAHPRSHNQDLLAAVLFVLGMGNLLVFVMKRIGIRRRRAETLHQQSA